jgi:RNA polymerase sigma-70 factor (ECF subfamily)
MVERARFESLIRQHWPAVRAVASRFATGADAADICQDVVLVAWRRREQLHDEAGFGPWVKRIALNVGRAHSRRREGRLGPMQEGDRPTPDPSQEVVDRCALEQALAELSQRERLTVEAHHVLGWPLADVAAAFGEPLGTTKACLSRARGKLRTELRGLGWTRLGRSEEDQR